MNHLAHTYISSGNAQEQAGNFVADWIKGSNLTSYPPDIRRGIVLHRFIDSYTDKHFKVKESKLRLKPVYGKYAGVVIDVLYDHFLAADWANYSNVTLPHYMARLEQNLTANLHLFPKPAQKYCVRFLKYRWPECYSTLEGIEQVLFAMSTVTSLPRKSEAALDIVREKYDTFAEEFKNFFSALMLAVQARRQEENWLSQPKL